MWIRRHCRWIKMHRDLLLCTPKQVLEPHLRFIQFQTVSLKVLYDIVCKWSSEFLYFRFSSVDVWRGGRVRKFISCRSAIHSLCARTFFCCNSFSQALYRLVCDLASEVPCFGFQSFDLWRWEEYGSSSPLGLWLSHDVHKHFIAATVIPLRHFIIWYVKGLLRSFVFAPHLLIFEDGEGKEVLLRTVDIRTSV